MAVVYLPQQSLDQDQIAALAYHLWDKRNRPDGAATEDWLEAERIMRDTDGPVESDQQEVTNQAA